MRRFDDARAHLEESRDLLGQRRRGIWDQASLGVPGSDCDVCRCRAGPGT